MMPYRIAINRTTTIANSTISAPRSSSPDRRPSFLVILHVRGPNADLLLCTSGGRTNSERTISPLARRCATCDLILGRRLSSVHRTYGPYGGFTRAAAADNGPKDLCTSPPSRRTLQRSQRRGDRVVGRQRLSV